MDTYVILKDLAIIIVFAKLFGILARKCKAPQVVGELIAGIVLGPSVLGLVQEAAMQKKDLLVVAIMIIAAIVLGAICGKLLLDNII